MDLVPSHIACDKDGAGDITGGEAEGEVGEAASGLSDGVDTGVDTGAADDGACAAWHPTLAIVESPCNIAGGCPPFCFTDPLPVGCVDIERDYHIPLAFYEAVQHNPTPIYLCDEFYFTAVTAGFEFKSMSNEDLPYALGLRTGDVLEWVGNDTERYTLGTQAEVLTAFGHMRNNIAERVVVRIKRGTSTLYHTYQVD